MLSIDVPPGHASALVAVPGTGSDADHVRRAFGGAARELGVELIAVQPASPLVENHLRALDEASSRHSSILVGGVSIGAAIALDWALRAGPSRCAGVLAALPAWSGRPEGTVAAISALATAEAVERDGLDQAVTAMVASSPDWLGAELSRSWRALGEDLTPQLRAAAHHRAPTVEEITRLSVPLAIVSATDDPIHPLDVAREWRAAAPNAELVEVGLQDWGRNPAVLGDGCLTALRRLAARSAPAEETLHRRSL